MKKLSTNQSGLTSVVVFPCKIPGSIITTKDKPAKNSPRANLRGVDGCLSPSFVQIHAKIGESVITNTGLSDWKLAGFKFIPQIDKSVLSAAKSANVDEPCSSIIQNSTAIKNNGMYAVNRDFSSASVFLLVIIIIK